MADNFTFPGGVNTYVPQLHADLVIEYSTSPAKFAINKYINVRKEDKQKGYYVKMKNDGQGRYVNSSDFAWADGNDAPMLTYGNDPFEFPPFSCNRWAYTKRLGYLAVEQGAWDVLDRASRLLAQQAMTARSRRVHTTLTTSGNWGSNYDTATNLGGGTWANATSTLPYIRKSLMAAFIDIQQATYSTIEMGDLYVVMNPNTAKVVATSQEFIDFLKQNPVALSIWEGQQQFRAYNLPESLFGLNVVVDATVYNSALPGPNVTPVFAYSFPDNYACLLTKQQAIKPAAGGSFSTFELFCYEDMETFVYNDVKNRRYDLQVVENVDDSVNALVAPQSGFLIATNS
jgi:hypothetical protein